MNSERINKHTVMFALNGHIGRHNGINARHLTMKVTGVMPTEQGMRSLRAVISELRMEGHAVCGLPSEGYYIANNQSELDDTCRFLYGRANSSIKMIARMRNVSEPDLKGQLRLPT